MFYYSRLRRKRNKKNCFYVKEPEIFPVGTTCVYTNALLFTMLFFSRQSLDLMWQPCLRFRMNDFLLQSLHTAPHHHTYEIHPYAPTHSGSSIACIYVCALENGTKHIHEHQMQYTPYTHESFHTQSKAATTVETTTAA